MKPSTIPQNPIGRGAVRANRTEASRSWKSPLTLAVIVLFGAVGLAVGSVNTTAGSLFRPGDIQSNLVGWWKLGEAPDPWADSSGRGNQLTEHNGVGISDDDYWGSEIRSADFVKSQSAYLSRAHAEANGLDVQSAGGSLSFGCWYRPRSLSQETLFWKGSMSAGYGMFAIAEAGNVAAFGFLLNGVQVLYVVSDIRVGQWAHVAVVFDEPADSVAIFVDGNCLGVANTTAQIAANTGDFWLGKSATVTGDCADGLMADVAFWSTALTALDIKSLAFGLDLAQESIRPASIMNGLVAYWPLNEIAGPASNVDRRDRVGSNVLTSVGSVGTGAGWNEGAAAVFTGRQVDPAPRLSIPSASISDDLKFDTAAQGFTISMWMLAKEIDGSLHLCQMMSDREGFSVVLHSPGYFYCVFAREGSQITSERDTNASYLKTNTWYHVCCLYDPDKQEMRTYLDGKPIFSEHYTGGLDTSRADLLVGSSADGRPTATFNGFISDLAIWDRALSPSEVVSLAIGFPVQSAGVSKRSLRDEEIKALYNRGLHGLETFPGETPGHSFTPQGDTFIDSSARMFGTHSLRLDGDGDFLSIADSEDWSFGQGDFTIDFWFNFLSLPDAGTGQRFFTHATDIHNFISLQLWNTGTSYDLWVAIARNNGFFNRTSSVALAQQTWHHLALVRSATTHWYVFLDRQQLDLKPAGGQLPESISVADYTGGFEIGRLIPNALQGEEYFTGWIDEFRISSMARWTNSFGVSNGEYVRDASTLFLLHFAQDEWDARREIVVEDRDNDGMPDSWELAHGLNPRVNDANDDLDLDGLTNLDEYTYGLTNDFKSDPSKAFTNGGNASDFELVTGKRENRFQYDRNDRLIGAQYANGLLIAYVYDGNSNLREQIYSSLQSESNRLPLFWRGRFGLDGSSSNKASGPWDDPDIDGWSNYQEWKSDSSPTDSTSEPSEPQRSIFQHAPETEILPEPASGGAISRVRIRVFDAEGNKVLPTLEYRTNSAAGNWNPAFIAEVEPGMVYTSALRVDALPTGSEHTLVWNARKEFPNGFTGKVYLRAQSQDVTLTGEPSTIAEYELNIATPPPLTLTLAKPANGAVFVEPADIELEAAVAPGQEERVVKVEFFELVAGKVGEDGDAPFAFVWEEVPVGAYRFFAEAIDDLSVRVRSTNGVSVVVDPGAPQLTVTLFQDSVSILWPASSEGYVLQETVSLSPPIAWSDMANTPVLENNQKRVQILMSNATKFYRLGRP